VVSAGGVALAFLISMGPRYAPLLKLNYHQSFFYLPGNSLDFGTYTVLAIMLRKMFKLDWRLRSIRDAACS
jgi:hypothetical protein